MQNSIEEINKSLERFYLEVLELAEVQKILEFIKKNSEDENFKKVLRVAPNFFNITLHSLISHLVLGLHEILADNAERPLWWHLEKMRGSQTVFENGGQFSDDELDVQINELGAARAHSQKLKKYRDKYFAHRDVSSINDPWKLWKNNHLTLDDTDKLLKLLQKVIGEHYNRVKGELPAWTFARLDVEDVFFKIGQHDVLTEKMQRAISSNPSFYNRFVT